MGPGPVRPKEAGEGPTPWPQGRPVAGHADPLGLWLRRNLMDAAGDAAAEPVPAAMLRITKDTCCRRGLGG